jgi:hypothetical protein
MNMFGEESAALPANFYGLCCAMKVGRGLIGAFCRGLVRIGRDGARMQGQLVDFAYSGNNLVSVCKC